MTAKMEEPTCRMHLKTPLAWMRSIDRWRGQQPDVPSRSEAVRRLVEIALEQEGPANVHAVSGRRAARSVTHRVAPRSTDQ
jgi:hypothetical protein